jgi:transcriptional regulator with XRE-family HTH domain
MEWGQRIRELRTAAEESQEALAEAAGVTKGAVSQWENGTVKTIRPENLFAVADHYRVEARWIVTGEEPRSTIVRQADLALETQLLQMYRALPESFKAMLLADANKYLTHANPEKSAANPYGVTREMAARLRAQVK